LRRIKILNDIFFSLTKITGKDKRFR